MLGSSSPLRCPGARPRRARRPGDAAAHVLADEQGQARLLHALHALLRRRPIRAPRARGPPRPANGPVVGRRPRRRRRRRARPGLPPAPLLRRHGAARGGPQGRGERRRLRLHERAARPRPCARERAPAGRRAWTVGRRSSARRPLPGLIGRERLDALQGPLRNGAMPTPLEAMALGSGAAVDVGVYAVDSRGAAAPASPARFRASQETVGHLVSRAVGSGPSRSGGPRGGSGSTARSGRPGSRATTASGSATASGPRARTARRCS